jgi:hypothetical protein
MQLLLKILYRQKNPETSLNKQIEQLKALVCLEHPEVEICQLVSAVPPLKQIYLSKK